MLNRLKANSIDNKYLSDFKCNTQRFLYFTCKIYWHWNIQSLFKGLFTSSL